jgi:hypothetical protein
VGHDRRWTVTGRPATGGGAAGEQAVPRWCVEVAEALDAVGRRIRRLAEHVAADWPDPRGGAWVERAEALHRELDGQARRATELARELGSVPGGPDATGRPGVRLGGLGGHRVHDERGVRIAELPPPADS